MFFLNKINKYIKEKKLKKKLSKTIKIILFVFIFLFFLQTFIVGLEPQEISAIESFEKEDLINEIKKMEKGLESNQNDYETITKLGLAYHFLSGRYNQKVSGKNEKYLMKSLKLKMDPLILAYFGMTEMQKAKKAINPFTKMEQAKNGLKIIDSAVDKAPDNYHVRLVRIKVSLKNKKLGRYPVAKNDIEHCETIYKNGNINNEDYISLLYFKGLYFEKTDNKENAKVIYMDIISNYPDSKAAILSKQSLANL